MTDQLDDYAGQLDVEIDLAAALALLDDLDMDVDWTVFQTRADEPELALTEQPNRTPAPQDKGASSLNTPRHHQRSNKTDWFKLAKLNKRERDAAQKENAKLRKLLASNAQIPRKFVQLTRRTAALAESLLIGGGASSTMRLYLGPVIELDETIRGLDALMEHADEVLTTGHFAQSSLQFREVSYRTCSTPTGEAIHVQLDMAWLLPFAVEHVATALWTQMARMVPREKLYSSTTIYQDAALVVAHTVAGPHEPSNNNKTADIHTQIASRRHPLRSDGSALILLSTHARLVTNDHVWVGSATGEAYVLVNSVSGHDADSLGPLARVRFCRRSRAQPPVESKLTQAQRSRWIDDTVVGGKKILDDKIDSTIQDIENLLLTPAF